MKLIINTKIVGYSAALLSAVLLGSEGVFVRNISADPYIITFVRLAFAWLFLILFLLFKGELKGVRVNRFSPALFLSGVMMSLAILCYVNSINNVSLAKAAFLLFLGPLVAVGIATIVLKEKLTLIDAAPLAFAFLGFLCLLEFDFSFQVNEARGYNWGIGSGVCYALYIVFNRKIPGEIPALTRSFYQFLFGAAVMLPFLDASLFNVTITDMLWMTGFAFFQGFLALTLIIVAVKHLKVVEFGTISYIEPLTAALVGYALYSEVLTPLQFTGCAIVLIAGIVQVTTGNSE